MIIMQMPYRECECECECEIRAQFACPVVVKKNTKRKIIGRRDVNMYIETKKKEKEKETKRIRDEGEASKKKRSSIGD